MKSHRDLSHGPRNPYDQGMAKELTPDEAIARAQVLQDDRLNAIRTVALARQTVADVREATARELAELQATITQRVGDAEREDVRAYNAAVSAGWTPDELRKIGFGEPDKKARVRRRAARRASASTSHSDAPAVAPDAPDSEHLDEDAQAQPVGV